MDMQESNKGCEKDDCEDGAADAPAGRLVESEVEQDPREERENQSREAGAQDQPEGNLLTAWKALVRCACERGYETRESSEGWSNLRNRVQ